MAELTVKIYEMLIYYFRLFLLLLLFKLQHVILFKIYYEIVWVYLALNPDEIIYLLNF